jgi:hypothetical protein
METTLRDDQSTLSPLHSTFENTLRLRCDMFLRAHLGNLDGYLLILKAICYSFK